MLCALALWRRLFFAGYDLARALAGARVGVSTLAANREATTMANASVTSEVHEALDRLLEVAAQIAFHFVVGVDHLADVDLLIRRQVVGLGRGIHFGGGEDFNRARAADAVGGGERDIHPLVFRQFDSSYACHRETLFLALALLVARVGA